MYMVGRNKAITANKKKCRLIYYPNKECPNKISSSIENNNKKITAKMINLRTFLSIFKKS